MRKAYFVWLFLFLFFTPNPPLTVPNEPGWLLIYAFYLHAIKLIYRAIEYSLLYCKNQSPR